MSNQSNNLRDDLLERATVSLRDMAVPDGPPADVQARVLAALRAAGGPSEPCSQPTFKQRILSMKPWTRMAVAAALTVAAGSIVLWAVLGKGTSVAFADVLQQLREVHTIKYKSTCSMSMSGDKTHTFTSEWIVADRYRECVTNPDGTVIIFDNSRGMGRNLTLDPQEKKALLTETKRTDTDGTQSNDRNLLNELTTLDETTAKPLGRQEIAGQMAEGFDVPVPNAIDKEYREVWVDIHTRLPVLIRYGTKPGVVPSVHYTQKDFEWNAPIDPSLVDMTPPPGYKVVNRTMDLTPPKEADLIQGMKTIAEIINDGQFLPELNAQAMFKATEKNEKTLRSKAKTMSDDERARLGERLSKAALSLQMVGNPEYGDDWHYAGAGVSLNQLDMPIIWYRPKGLATYRVIYADLTVKDVAPADLPQVESVAIPQVPAPATSQPQVR